MCGFAVYRDRESSDPLALGLDVAFLAHCRFEDERASRTTRKHSDVPGRSPAARFLVGVEEYDRSQWNLDIKFLQGVQGEHEL